MKRFYLTCLITLSGLYSFAQISQPSETRLQLAQLRQLISIHGADRLSASQLEPFPAMQIDGDWYISFMAKLGNDFSPSDIADLPVFIGSRVGQIATLRVRADYLDQVDLIPGIQYLQIAEPITQLNDKLVHDIGADSVHQGINLPMPFAGKDVIIGITDWGFDYTHPMFYDTSMTQTRILAAWDQFKVSGPAPAGYSYGTEYSDIPSLLDAGSDTANQFQYGYHYHGTHVAGIAGGSGGGTAYRGVAFESEFLFCSLKIDETAVVDAFVWMKDKAESLGKRLVINMSWGLYYMGTLDGNSLLSQVIDQLTQQGVVFVCSAANNGGTNFHIKKNYSQDTLKTRINFLSSSPSTPTWGQSVTMWGTPGNNFKVALAVLNSSNQQIAQTPFYSTDSLAFLDTNLVVVPGDTLFYYFSADSAHPINQRPHMRLRVRNNLNPAYRIALFSTADAGLVHYWNLVMRSSVKEANWGWAFSNQSLPGWTAGDSYYGVSEPSVTSSLISVGAYLSQTGISGGTLASFSSWGPRIDDVLKPEISGPGVQVASSISSYTNTPFTLLTSVNFNSQTYPFAKLSGTSMSGPAVAGVVALMLNANPWLSPDDVKDIIIATAREDSKTGDIPDTGSVAWGHGKVDAYQAVLASYYFVGNAPTTHNTVIVYPNPFDEQLIVSGISSTAPYHAIIRTMDSRIIKTIRNLSGDAVIDLSGIASGMYILELNGGIQQRIKIIRR